MAEQRPFKPFVESSILSALTSISPPFGGLFVSRPIEGLYSSPLYAHKKQPPYGGCFVFLFLVFVEIFNFIKVFVIFVEGEKVEVIQFFVEVEVFDGIFEEFNGFFILSLFE